MNDLKLKEFQTLALAALFHDIGKVLNRTKDGYKKNHTELTKNFLEKLVNDCKNVIGFVDEKIFSDISSHHHESPNNKLLKPNEISNDRAKFLATIISRADNFSSSERSEDDDAKESNRTKSRIRSIFYNLNFENSDNTNGNDGFYEIKELSPENIFSKNEDPFDKENTQFAYKVLAEKITEEIKMIEAKNNFNLFFSEILSILEKYLALVPSNTQFDKQSVSLFDHMSTTSAIACAYYMYLEDQKMIKISDLDRIDKKTDIKPFILLQGDLSGIQNFILMNEGANSRGMTKTLRGRSFYISMLSRAVSLKLISDFNLVNSNIFIDAGGKFSIILPNTDTVKNKISEIRRNLDEFFFKKFSGLLSLNISEPVEMSVKDFSAESKEDQPGFQKIFKKLMENNQFSKKNKFFSLFKESGKADNLLGKLYDELSENGVCEICGVLPKNNEEGKCSICEKMEKIGQKLVKDKLWVVYSRNNRNCIDEIIPDVYVDVINSEEDVIDLIDSSISIDRFLDSGKDEKIIGSRRWINNYVPFGKDFYIDTESDKPNEDSLCYYCNDRCKLEPEEDELARKDVKNGLLTFQCIATCSRKIASKDLKEKAGVDHLGILKADVDNLGKIFRESMQEKLSISRIATLSRFLNYFFTEVLQKIIKDDEKGKFSSIYTVYSGGDDLFLIGPWIVLPEFALYLSKKFKEFTGTDNVTFSCGIEFFRPRFPIGRAVEIVDKSLERSKRGEKGKITVFKNTVKLFKKTKDEKGFKELYEYSQKLDELSKKGGGKDGDELINKGFLYRLLSFYRPMFLEAKGFKEEDSEIPDNPKVKVLSYRYVPLLKRDIKRNIIKDRKDTDLVQRSLVEIEKLIKQDEEGIFLMKNLRIPAFLTIYKLRGGDK